MDHKLTKPFIQSAACPAGKSRVYFQDTEVRGLALCVTNRGAKTYYRCGRVRGVYKRIRIASAGEISLKVARERCQEISGRVAGGDRFERPTPSRTLGELWGWYLENHAKQNKRSWKNDVKNWDNHLRQYASLPVDEISRVVAKDIVFKSLDSGRGVGHNCHALLRSIFNVAIDNEWIERNPFSRIKIPTYNSRERFLSVAELDRFVLATYEHGGKFRDPILVALYTGARRENIMSMRWAELDFDSHVWTIPPDKSKNKKQMRIPLLIQVEKLILSRPHVTEFVFPSRAKSGHLNDPFYAIQRITKAAGIKNFTFHDLRHTFATYQDMSGSPLQHIQASLSHLTMSQTQKYAHSQIESARQSMQATAALVDASREKIENR